MDELIAITGVCLTGAAMTVTVLVLGASEELIPARNAMFIRIPALMLASLVIGSICTGLVASLGVVSGLVRTVFLATFAVCLGELLFLSVFFLRVPVFATVLNGRYWQFANSHHLWTASTIVLSLLLFLVLASYQFMLRPVIFCLALVIGWTFSMLFMLSYVRYGFGGYEELFTAG